MIEREGHEIRVAPPVVTLMEADRTLKHFDGDDSNSRSQNDNLVVAQSFCAWSKLYP